MTIEDTIREIQRRTPLPPPGYVTYGQWISPAWVVRGLVEQQWGVTEAVRQVVATMKLQPERKALNGVKAAYYIIRNKPWPTTHPSP